MLQLQSEAEKLEQLYLFRDKKRVVAFIKQNPNLYNLLLDAPSQIKSYFPNAILALEEVIDIEFPQKRDLWIWINVQNYDEATFVELDELIENWWIDAADAAQAYNMGVNLDWQ